MIQLNTERTNNADVTYAITGGTDEDLFNVRTGQTQGIGKRTLLELSIRGDFVRKAQYEVEITATNTATMETAIQMFTLTVPGYPETPPVIKLTLPAGQEAINYVTPLDVNEDDTDIITFTIEDPDKNYAASAISVVDGDGMTDARFTVMWDEANQMGTLQAPNGVDFEALNPPFGGSDTDPRWTETFIRVTDAPEGSIASGDDARVVLRVTDVVEPITINLIDGKEYTTTDTIHTATTELDGTITYALGGTDANLFNIDSTSGAVTFKADTTLNDDTKDTYKIDITATDASSNTESQSIIFDVSSIAFTTPLDESFTIFEFNVDKLVSGAFNALDAESLDYETTGTSAKPTAAVTGGIDMGIFDVKVATTTSTTGRMTVVLQSNDDFVKKNQYEVEFTITNPATMESDVRAITLIVINRFTGIQIPDPAPPTAPAPITPDRTEQQAEAHDPHDPDDDPLAGLTQCQTPTPTDKGTARRRGREFSDGRVTPSG